MYDIAGVPGGNDENLFANLLLQQQDGGQTEPPISAPDSGVNFVSLLEKANTLFPDQSAEQQKLLTEREALTGTDAMKKRAGIGMGGMGVIALLAMLGGGKGRAGMGNAMNTWGQGWNNVNDLQTARDQANIDKKLEATGAAQKERGSALKTILMRSMLARQGGVGAGGEKMPASIQEWNYRQGITDPKQRGEFDTFLGRTGKVDKAAELPADVRAFQAFNPGMKLGTPEASQAYVEWQKSMKNDPYLGYAVQSAATNIKTINMDQKQLADYILSMRDALKQKLSGGVDTSGLKFGNVAGSLPTIRYDAQGNRVQ